MSIFLPPAPVCRAGEVLQRGAELFLLPLPFPSCADKSNIKIFLPNFTFNGRNCRRKIAEENCVWLLTQKVILHHPPHLCSTWVLPLNGPEKPIAPPYILSFVLCIYFPLSKTHGLMVCRKNQVMGNHCLPKRALVQASHLLIGKLKYWKSWDNEGIELWLPISFCILARTGEMPSALGLREVKRWSFLSWRGE